jgi:acyl-CoA thioester hydrolase
MVGSLLSHDMEMIVAWSDCDAAGISYYAKSFEWFTDGYMALLSNYGFPYMETFHHNGISLVSLKADCQYKKMLRPLEKIIVRVSLTLLTRSRMEFSYQIMKDNGEIAAEGYTQHAFVNTEGRPFNLQKHFPILWEKINNKCTKG